MFRLRGKFPQFYHKFRIPPIFAISIHFPFLRKLFFPITIQNLPPVFVKFTCFLHNLCVFRFPLVWPWCIYASHNAHRSTGRLWWHLHEVPLLYTGCVVVDDRVFAGKSECIRMKKPKDGRWSSSTQGDGASRIAPEGRQLEASSITIHT